MNVVSLNDQHPGTVRIPAMGTDMASFFAGFAILDGRTTIVDVLVLCVRQFVKAAGMD